MRWCGENGAVSEAACSAAVAAESPRTSFHLGVGGAQERVLAIQHKAEDDAARPDVHGLPAIFGT